MAHDVFISYSSKDREIAEAAYNALQEAGIQCWMDQHSILPGEGHGGAIIRGISASRLMLLVLSDNSNGSPDVLREVERAAGKRLQIIPWRIEELELSDDFQYFLSYGQRLDALTRPIGTHLPRLVAAVKHYLPNENSSKESPSTNDDTSTGTSADANINKPVGDASTPPTAKLPNSDQHSESAGADTMDETSSSRKTNREEFLSQCDEYDRQFFTDLLNYCDANRRKVIIDWGGRGFSLKDSKQRPLIWMFPTRSEWSVQIRTLKFTRSEIEKVKDILYLNRITGNSWKPRDLSLEQTEAIINLLCRIPPAKTAESSATPNESSLNTDTDPTAQSSDESNLGDAPVFAESQDVDITVADVSEASSDREMNRIEFLEQCNEYDRTYFTQVLDYCDANRRKIIIDWGGKGFSLKDAKQRPLIWMFPTRGDNWNIQIRTLKFTAREVQQVKDVLYDNRITGNSWRPRDLPVESLTSIIDLLCRIAPPSR